MSKLNQVQAALKAIDQARFQKLGDAYLRKLGYDAINPLGSVIGFDKVKIGTPDTFVPLPNGKYLFVEYTTQQSGLAGKFEKDLRKCFDPERVGIPIEAIEEIILCHNTQLELADDHSLRSLCAQHGCKLTIIGMGNLSHDLVDTYPGLAKDYLNIDIDTGQIVDEDRFISMYQTGPFASRIDTSFVGREEELETALRELETHDVLLVTGRAGTGKTRFVRECCRSFAEAHPGYIVRYIYYRTADIFNDLRVHFSQPGEYLIVVDDANRLYGHLEYVLQLLQEAGPGRRFKIVCTVRDYARDTVRDKTGQYAATSEITIPSFKDEDIYRIVRAEFPTLLPHALERIARLAEGNPRIAMMAAALAYETNQMESIRDVSNLYDKYFESIGSDVAAAKDPELWRVAGIITFFRTIDRTNEGQMELLRNVFSIDLEAFWSHAQRLHDLEIVDMYEGGELVRIADQVLATYLFYRAAFREKVLDLRPIITQLFPQYREHLMDAINPVFTSFDEQAVSDTLRPSVIEAWEQFEREGKVENLFELMGAFWWLAETKVLKMLRDHIVALDSEVVDLNEFDWKPNSGVPRSSPLSILAQMKYSELNETAISLILEYGRKQPGGLSHVLHVLIDDYGFSTYSHLAQYRSERMVLDAVWDRWISTGRSENGRLFIAIAAAFIRTHYMSTTSRGRYRIMFQHFDLVPTDELRELRQTMLARLFELYASKELQEPVIEVLRSYTRMGYENEGKEIGTWDMEVILPFVAEHLDADTYRDCTIVQDLIAHCRRYEIAHDPEIATRFRNATYDLAEFLDNDREELHELGYDEYRRQQGKSIRVRFATSTREDYSTFLGQCREILDATSASYQDYPFRERMFDVLIALAERDGSLFGDVMQEYLKSGDPLQIWPYAIVEQLITLLGRELAHEIVGSTVGESAEQWKLTFYQALPADEVTMQDVENLLAYYARSNWNLGMYRTEHFQKFAGCDPDFMDRIIALFLERAEEDKQLLGPLHHLFNVISRSDKDIELLRTVSPDLLQRAYLETMGVYQSVDHHGIVFDLILDDDPLFLRTYIREQCNRHALRWWHDDRDYSFLWEREDYEKVIKQGVEEAFACEQERCLSVAGFPRKLLSVSSEAVKRNPGIPEKIIRLLENIIITHHTNGEYMEFIFDAASEKSADMRRQIIRTFLQHNSEVEAFRSLQLAPNHWSSENGSMVPAVARQKEFLESLLPLLTRFDLLEHREVIEQRIDHCRQWIENEKKRDFLRE